MLKKVYAVRNNKDNTLFTSRPGIRYYERKRNAKKLRDKLIRKGVSPKDLSIIGYMMVIIEIDDEGVKAE